MDPSTLVRGLGARAGWRPVPIALSFELTHLCNLDCRYCDRHTPAPGEMTREQIFTALDGLHSLGMRHVCLDGGEALAHRHVDEITAFLLQRDVRVFMNSNGALIPKKLATVRLLSKVKVSIDGPAECHDAMRGAGSWQKAMRGALAAREVGVPVELSCVVGRHNVDHVDELVDLAQRAGLSAVFQPARHSLVLDSARGGADFVAEAAAVRRAFRKLEVLKLAGSRGVGNRWSSLRHFRAFPNHVAPPCAAGHINATLDPQGNLFHCGQVSRADRRHNVVALGARAAFEGLTRGGCGQCWCARVVEENYAWGGRFLRMLPPLGAAPPTGNPALRLDLMP